MRLSLVRSILATIATASLFACTPNQGPNVTTPLFATTTIDSTAGTVTTTSLAVDVSQRVHVLYSGGSTLRYATCGGLCAQATSWQHVTVDTTTNSGLSSSLIIDPSGLHATYQVLGSLHWALRYASCATSCVLATSWQLTTIDSAGFPGDASLAVDGSGVLHVTYVDQVGGVSRALLKYAICSTACSTATNWQITVLDSAIHVSSSSRALAIDGASRQHLVYQRADSASAVSLYYSRCDTGCGSATNWQSTQIDPSPLFDASPVIALDPNGHPRSAYWGSPGGTSTITYASCDTQCTTPNAWRILPIQVIESGSSDLLQHSLVIDATGSPHMSFQHAGLSYAGCTSTICVLPGSWFEVPIEANAGSGSSVGALPVGLFRAVVVYLSVSGALRFAESN